METTTVHIAGMTCGHCTSSVHDALVALPGVEAVDVQLDAGTATLTAEGPVDPGAVAKAVTEAGFTVVDPGAAAAGETPDDVDNLLI